MEMQRISTDDFMRLRAKLPAVTAPHLFEVYRISETTWRRMRKGEAIRTSTLQRIMARYQQLE